MEQWQVDAFASVPFTGNPAAIVFEHRDDRFMQNLATENNLAETAYLQHIDDNNGQKYRLRWFTPNSEVELCGHATLASAHALYESNRVKITQDIEFHTLYSGILTCSRNDNGSLNLNFPITPSIPISFSQDNFKLLLDGLGLSKGTILYIGKSKFDILVEITPQAFSKLKTVDFNAISGLGGRGVVVTSLGGKHHQLSPNDDEEYDNQGLSVFNSSYDFVSRCFFPLFGINEDPVTGSAHCMIAPYWNEKLQDLKGSVFTAYQASSRGGLLLLQIKDERVVLTGSCVTTIKSLVLV